MSGGQAETLLQAKGEPWTFLVRESLSQPGDFVLSVLSDQPKAGPGSPLKVTHIKVMCEVRCLDSGEAPSWVPSVLRALPMGRASLGFGPRLGVKEGDSGPESWSDLVPLQGGRYTVGGPETFDSLTDLVEHFKKTGIEEASGAFVYLRQVRGGPGCLLLCPQLPALEAADFSPSPTPAILCHEGERG